MKYKYGGCSGLTSVISEIAKPFEISDNVFSDYSKPILTVPSGAKSAYQSTNYWNKFTSIVEKEASEGGHMEVVKKTVWTNNGTSGEDNGSYCRFASENHTSEAGFIFLKGIWNKLKLGTFYATIKGDNPKILVTTGWWTARLTDGYITPGSELLTDNGDGTWTLEISLIDNLPKGIYVIEGNKIIKQ